MTYRRQKNSSDCGPTSLYNALEWALYDIKPKHYSKIKQLAGYNKTGMTADKAVFALRKFKMVKTEILPTPTLKELIKHLDNGGAFILFYFTDTSQGAAHATFCFGMDGEYLKFANDSEYYTVKKRHAGEVMNYLDRRLPHETDLPVAILLTRVHPKYKVVL